jgi:hypothetical protein
MRENKMSADAAITALIFAIVALAHIVRIINRWAVQIGPFSVSMSVSWVGFVVATLLAILGLHAIRPINP